MAMLLSEHTWLMNACIGFCKDTGEWPSPLKNAGYQLEKIEPLVKNSDGDSVNPDLLFSSNSELHALITECKGGSLSEDTVCRLKKILPDRLTAHVNVYDEDGLSCENWYVGTPIMGQSFEVLDIPNAGTVIREKELSIINQFEDSKLNSEFQQTQINGNVPVSFYPFGPDDPRAIIAERVAQHLVHMAAKGKGPSTKITPEEIASEAHPYWNQIDDAGQRALIRKVEDALTLFEEKDVEGDLRQIEGSRVYYVRTSQALQRKINEVIEELAEERDMDRF